MAFTAKDVKELREITGCPAQRKGVAFQPSKPDGPFGKQGSPL